MNKISSLETLGIRWQGKPNRWLSIPRNLLPTCDAKGTVRDASGVFLYRLKGVELLGEGTFGRVDKYVKKNEKGEEIGYVAMKKNNHPQIDLLCEALFQWQLHREMKAYGLEFAIPPVYQILLYKPTGDIFFTMEPYKATLLSDWLERNIHGAPLNTLPLLLLQISLVLEVFEKDLKIDHRDLKVNNILVIEEPISVKIIWEKKEQILHFPFRIIFVDFGFACIQRLLDLREGDGLPPLDPCPKEGRDIFQVLVSLWSRSTIRGFVDSFWAGWIREKIRGATGRVNCLYMTENYPSLDWMYSITDLDTFSAPGCAPWTIIEECMKLLGQGEKK